jgi:hypothetical protein
MTMTTNNAFSANERAFSYSLTRAALSLLLACTQDLSWLRRKLKQAITLAYAWGVIDAVTAQCLIDRLELWAD